MTNHTKGTWTQMEQGNIYAFDQDGPIGGVLICTLSKNNPEANGKLIIAAPDSVEALEIVLDQLQNTGYDDGNTIQIIKHALAKVKGHSNG